MYSAYTIDEVLETASCFVKNVNETYEELNDRLETVENLYFNQVKEISKNEELQDTAQQLIKSEHKKRENIRIRLEKNKVHLQDLEGYVTKLKELKSDKEGQLLKLEQDVNRVRETIQSTLDDKEDIKTKKDEILAFKLLTNTSFVYTTKRVTGIVTKDPPKSFTFNPQELPQEEITEKLWQLVLEDKI